MRALTNFLITICAIEHYVVVADFEVCTPGTSSTVFKFTFDSCPFGVLFEEPITATCMASTNPQEHFITDLCNPGRKQMGINDNPYQIQLSFQMDPEPVVVETSCYGVGPNKCDALTMTVTTATTETLTPPLKPGCDADYDAEVEDLSPEEEKARKKDYKVFNQTERLFKQMLGLIRVNGQDDASYLRLVKLLKSTFKIFKKFIGNTRFIPPDFGDDVLTAFLFLFRESDLTTFEDISIENFLIISKSLTACEKTIPPFTLVGRSCRTCAHAYSIEKMGTTLRYEKHEDQLAFKWGKHDVPTDATWNIISFVHGVCYGTYSKLVNFHHLYAQEMERLFTPEILYRWTRPTQLYHEHLWDHIFSASIKNTMRNLDVAIFGAYHDTPFMHRLERPIDKIVRTNSTKSSVSSTMSLDEVGLKGAGWCFQTEVELVQIVAQYIGYHCPNVPFPEEINATIESPEARDALFKFEIEPEDSFI